MIAIEILDSSPLFSLGLRQALRSSGMDLVVVTWPDEPDVLLLDPTVVVPRDPYQYVAEQSQTRSVVIISDEQPLPMERYRRHGAAGVVGRRDPVHVVVAAVRAAAGRTGPWQSACPELSEREKQVLHCISNGFTHSQTARQLGISQHTVDTYVKRIRMKLKAGNKADLTRAALSRVSEMRL